MYGKRATLKEVLQWMRKCFFMFILSIFYYIAAKKKWRKYMSQLTVEVTDQNFKEKVLDNTMPVLVDFWAPWCGPCRLIAPKLEEIAKDYEGKVVIAKVNVDNSPMIAGKFGIRSIPTLLFVKDGKVMDQVIGNVPKSELEAHLAKLM
jgi:thioredoxin 1